MILLPNELINHILGYYTDLVVPAWIPSLSRQDILTYHVNPTHKKYQAIYRMLQNKKGNPPTFHKMYTICEERIVHVISVWISKLVNDFYKTRIYACFTNENHEIHYSELLFTKKSNRIHFSKGNTVYPF
jgi:hypothetical protein